MRKSMFMKIRRMFSVLISLLKRPETPSEEFGWIYSLSVKKNNSCSIYLQSATKISKSKPTILAVYKFIYLWYARIIKTFMTDKLCSNFINNYKVSSYSRYLQQKGATF